MNQRISQKIFHNIGQFFGMYKIICEKKALQLSLKQAVITIMFIRLYLPKILSVAFVLIILYSWKFWSEYVDELDGRFCELPKSSAALFCYFNSLDLFHKYLDNFKGARYSCLGEIPQDCWYFSPPPGFCVILIGPKDGRRHCEPEPRYLEEECGDTWRLYVRTLLPHKSYLNQKTKIMGAVQTLTVMSPTKNVGSRN